MNKLLLRFGILGVAVAGFLLIARFRPRELPVEVDLTGVGPGAIRLVDVTVTRDGSALLRREQKFAAGAPRKLLVVPRTTPGPVELDVTLVDDSGAASRERLQVTLHEVEEGAPPPVVVFPKR